MTDDHGPSYCDCIGTYVLQPYHHAEDCPRYRPPFRGPGSTPAHRAAALAHIRATLTRRRENP